MQMKRLKRVWLSEEYMKILKKNIKEGDVFNVWYKERTYMDDHCFEGLLIARKENNDLIFKDTYWGLNSPNEGKRFTYTEMIKKLMVKYYCNINEIQSINSREFEFYKPEDRFMLYEQHACVESCKHYFIRKGSERDKRIIMDKLNEEIQDARRKLKYKIDEIIRLEINYEKVSNDDLSVV